MMRYLQRSNDSTLWISLSRNVSIAKGFVYGGAFPCSFAMSLRKCAYTIIELNLRQNTGSEFHYHLLIQNRILGGFNLNLMPSGPRGMQGGRSRSLCWWTS